MALLDFILNLACLLLWTQWLTPDSERFNPQPGASLLSTLKSADRKRSNRWITLGALIGILVIRAVIYWNLGSTANWAAKLNFHAVALSFRSDSFARMITYSLLGFGHFLGGFYIFVLLLAIVHRRSSPNDPSHRLIRSYLRSVAGWPWFVLLLLPPIVYASLWISFNSLFTHWGICPAPVSSAHLWQQAAVVALSSYIGAKYLIVAALVLFLINSYVFLGNLPFWNFVNETGHRFLAPLSVLPLRVGKLDLAPIIAIAFVFMVAEFAERNLPALFQRLPI